ncbi:hypothetical protein [Serratia phage X20]|uniref:Uncharacterized protein n=1 Tax=Serratia phage X20 TaxID=2006942 RepID=A0A1Z1LZ00_9CAUD|nr:hypothetical protein KNT72_gp081 [Serratia phage X20]ARW58054.1 hypothetical protein [Serratia phage X20]
MQTKTLAGNNTPEFVSWVKDKGKTYEETIIDLYFAAYEDGIDITHLKDYLGSILEMHRTIISIKVDSQISSIKRKEINLPDSEILACAAHEAKKEYKSWLK